MILSDVDGYLFQAPEQSEEQLEQERLAALRAGIDVVRIEKIRRFPFWNLDRAFDSHGRPNSIH